MNITSSVLRLEREIETLRRRLLALGPLHPGSISEQYHVCRNPGCCCMHPHRPQRHGPYHKLAYVHRGRPVCRFVRSGCLREIRFNAERSSSSAAHRWPRPKAGATGPLGPKPVCTHRGQTEPVETDAWENPNGTAMRPSKGHVGLQYCVQPLPGPTFLISSGSFSWPFPLRASRIVCYPLRICCACNSSSRISNPGPRR